MDATRLAHDLV
jgi:hypothetical protein